MFQKLFFFFIATLAIIAFSGCSRYYKAIVKQPAIKTIDSLKIDSRYFIVRDGLQAFAMNNVMTNDDDQSIHFTLDTLPEIHSLYLTHARDGKMRYKASRNEQVVLDEVHLFTKDQTYHTGDSSTLNVSQLQRLDIITRNKGKTTASYILGGLGITVAVPAVIVAIAALTNHKDAEPSPPPPPSGDIGICSPQIFSVVDSNLLLNGTLCSGSIYASLQRTDYLPVTQKSGNSETMNFMLRGEPNEELVMNNFQLVKVTHKANEKILIDKNGKVLVFSNPVLPDHAIAGPGRDVVKKVSAGDDQYYSFDNQGNDGKSDIVLDFQKPKNAERGKLILKGKNSQWAFYVFNEFKKLFGSKYQELISKKDKQDHDKVLQCEIDQNLPLLVFVQEGTSWKFADYFQTPGNALSRELIMELDLKNFKSQDHIRIKLQTAYRFWDVDYIGMDFSDERSVKIAREMPTNIFKISGGQATNISFENVAPVGFHIKGNEMVALSFAPDKPAPGLVNSYFMSGSGYYHDKTAFDNKPRLKELKQCVGTNAFDRFSRKKFAELTGINKDQQFAKKDVEIFK